MTVESTGAGMPEVLVLLARPLLALFPDAVAEVRVTAATVDRMIDALDARWPGMGHRLRDETPRIRPHLSIFCDGQRATLNTPLAHGTMVYVLTAMSGG